MTNTSSTVPKPFDLTDRTVVVTGATGILGRHFCRALALNGATVLVADLNLDACQQFAAEISETYSVPAHGVSVDLANETSVQNWTNAIFQHVSQVDVLVNNAAAKPKGFFAATEEYDLETWNQTWAVNVTGIFLATKYLSRDMLRRKQGNIINLSSIYGVVGPDQRIYEGSWYEELGGPINTPLIYSATKGAVLSMTRYLATTWGGDGIRTNSITPGGISSGQNSEFNRRYSDRVPLGRMAEASDLVGALLYLASDASRYVNGHNLVVDGGWTAW